jgi:hypothetical protein
MLAGEHDQSLRAGAVGHGFREREGVGAAVPMNDQFREQHQVDFLRGRACAPRLDLVEHSLGFAEVPVHAHGSHASGLHRYLHVPRFRASPQGGSMTKVVVLPWTFGRDW